MTMINTVIATVVVIAFSVGASLTLLVILAKLMGMIGG